MKRYATLVLALLLLPGCLESPPAPHAESAHPGKTATDKNAHAPDDAHAARETVSDPAESDTRPRSRRWGRNRNTKTASHAPRQHPQHPTPSRRGSSPEPSVSMEENPDGTRMLKIQAGQSGAYTIGASQLLQSMRGSGGMQDGSRPTDAPSPREPLSVDRPDNPAFTQAAGRGEEEYRFLQTMIDAPDPAHAARVIRIATTPSHPFSELAWHALGGIDTPATRNAIRTTLQGDDTAQHCAALGALLQLDPQEATRHARRILTHPTPDIRLAALTVLGETRDTASRAAVRRMADEGDPVIRMRVGWVLLELDDPEGARILRSFASSADPAFAVQAMSILTHRKDADSLPLFYHNLYHNHDRIMMTALECIERFPESARERALLTMPEEIRDQLVKRRILLLCYAGSFPVSKPILDAARAEHPSDRLYAMRSILRHRRTEHLGTLLELAFDPDPRVREEAQAGARGWLHASGLQGVPTEFKSREAWQRWWFREHRILATAPGQVLLSLPTGEVKPFRLGSRLDFDAVVESVRMGYGEDNRAGALVMINCGGRPLSLTP